MTFPEPILHFDFAILDWIAAHLQNPVFDAISVVLSVLGDYAAPWLLLAAVLLWMPKYRKWAVVMLIALALEVVCTDVLLKAIVARPRPFLLNPDVTLIVSPPGSFSFPSGHSGSCFACAVTLCFSKKKRLWIPALSLALLTALSRIYLYVHYPSDVIAGVILGTLCALVTVLVASPYIRRPAQGTSR